MKTNRWRAVPGHFAIIGRSAWAGRIHCLAPLCCRVREAQANLTCALMSRGRASAGSKMCQSRQARRATLRSAMECPAKEYAGQGSGMQVQSIVAKISLMGAHLELGWISLHAVRTAINDGSCTLLAMGMAWAFAVAALRSCEGPIHVLRDHPNALAAMIIPTA